MIRSTVPWLAIAFFGAPIVPSEWIAAQDVGSTEVEREGRMAVMTTLVNEIRMFETIAGHETELKRSENPVTHFNDSVRQFEDGTLWAYTRNNRPVALIKCVTNESRTRRWWMAVASLSTNRLRAEKSGRNVWTPEKPGVVFLPLPNTPPPAPTSTPRHLQLRQVARRFKAHQFWKPGNQRFELRLSSRPVLVYSDESSGVLDGGIFVFTHGVSPALAVVIEAVDGEETPSWRYAIAKMGSAEFHASLDGKEVYQSPRAPAVTGRPVDPYFLFLSTASE